MKKIKIDQCGCKYISEGSCVQVIQCEEHKGKLYWYLKTPPPDFLIPFLINYKDKK